MINTALLERVRYPDEIDGLYFDTLDYEEVVSGLKFALKTAEGQLKADLQETLNELQRRWTERQSSIA